MKYYTYLSYQKPSEIDFYYKNKILMIKEHTKLSYKMLFTPIGPMIALASKKKLFALQFVDEGALEEKMNLLTKELQATVNLQKNLIIDLIERELELYFAGKLKRFTVPISIQGSSFQKLVWNELQNIPFAATKSYSEIASCINKPNSHRAIGRANGANRFVIIIPCHRVIYIDSTVGGYTGGIARKQWLLHHERQAVLI